MDKIQLKVIISPESKEKLKLFQSTNMKSFHTMSSLVEYLIDNLDKLSLNEPTLFKQKDELITRLTTRCELSEQELAALKEILELKEDTYARSIETWKQRCELLQLQNEHLQKLN